MSPRAAWRLESLGFTDVYDYVPGKADWLAHGMPTEGEHAGHPTAATVARRDVPVCGLQEKIEDVRERVAAAGTDVCVVVNDERVVFGILRADALKVPGGILAEHAMRSGPSTFRPNVAIVEMAKYLTDHDLVNVPVTTADGRLVGVLFRDDAQRAAQE